MITNSVLRIVDSGSCTTGSLIAVVWTVISLPSVNYWPYWWISETDEAGAVDVF